MPPKVMEDDEFSDHRSYSVPRWDRLEVQGDSVGSVLCSAKGTR